MKRSTILLGDISQHAFIALHSIKQGYCILCLLKGSADSLFNLAVLWAWLCFYAELVLRTYALDLVRMLLLGLVHALQSAAVGRAFLNTEWAKGCILGRSSKCLLLFPSSSSISLTILTIFIRLLVNVRFLRQELRLNDFIHKALKLKWTC